MNRATVFAKAIAETQRAAAAGVNPACICAIDDAEENIINGAVHPEM